MPAQASMKKNVRGTIQTKIANTAAVSAAPGATEAEDALGAGA